MNQQHSTSSRQVSTSVTPGAGYQVVNKTYEVKTYQYEQQFGGIQSQMKPITMQQDYSMQHQHNTNQNFSPFQIPIQKGQSESLQQQNLNTSKIFQKQNQFQKQEEVHSQNHRFQPPNKSQFQGGPLQGQFQGPFQAPQSQGHFQGAQPQGRFQGHQPQGQFQGPQPQGQIPVYFEKDAPQGQFQEHPAQNSTEPQNQYSGRPQEQFPGAHPQGMPALGRFQGGPQVQFQSQRQPQPQQIREENYGEMAKEWPPKTEGGPNLTTTHPSGFKLRNETPMDHSEGVQVVPAQPAFKITQPVRRSGDEKWPPRKGDGEITQEQVREFIKPKKPNRDYTEFFAQNALPNQYPSYRVPPGTQHRGMSQE